MNATNDTAEKISADSDAAATGASFADFASALDEIIEYLKYRAECGERSIEIDNETAVTLFSPDFIKIPFAPAEETPPAPPTDRTRAQRPETSTGTPNQAGPQNQARPQNQAAKTQAPLPRITGLPTLPSLSARPKQMPAPRPLPSVSAALPVPGNTLQSLFAEISNCRKCPLCEKRIKTAMGKGNSESPDVMFIGEAPTPQEESGSGAAASASWSQLLVKMIGAMGYGMGDIYITGICKCRPAANQIPGIDELSACLPHLKDEIAAVRPKTIVALGSTAVSAILGSGDVRALRGKWKIFCGIPLMPTYHPAFLLRNPAEKKDAWFDLKAVMAKLGK